MTEQIDVGTKAHDVWQRAAERAIEQDVAVIWFRRYGASALGSWWSHQSRAAKYDGFQRGRAVGGGNSQSESWNHPTLRSALGDDIFTVSRFRIDGEWVRYGDMRKYQVHAMVLRDEERISHFRADLSFWKELEGLFKTDGQPLSAVLTVEDHYRLCAKTGAVITKGDTDTDAEIAQLEEE